MPKKTPLKAESTSSAGNNDAPDIKKRNSDAPDIKKKNRDAPDTEKSTPENKPATEAARPTVPISEVVINREEIYQSLTSGKLVNGVPAKVPQFIKIGSPSKPWAVSRTLLQLAETILQRTLKEFGSHGEFLESVYGPPIEPADAEKYLKGYMKLKKGSVVIKWDEKLPVAGRVLVSCAKVPDKRVFRILIRSGSNNVVTKFGIESFAAHEIGTHLLRSVNEQMQPWASDRKAFGLVPPLSTREELATEEGLATLHTVLPLGSKHLWNAAMLYYAAVKAEDLGFEDLYSHLCQYIPDCRARFLLAMRAKTGVEDPLLCGGSGRCQVYLEGAVQILNQLGTLPFKTLMAGKISIGSLNRVKRLVRCSTTVLPSFMSNMDEYLSQLRHIGVVNGILTARPRQVKTGGEKDGLSKSVDLGELSRKKGESGIAAAIETAVAKPPPKKQSIAEVRTPQEERRSSERSSCRQSSVKLDPKNSILPPSDRTRKNVVDAKPPPKKRSIAEVRTPQEERRASERPRSNSCRQSSVKLDHKNSILPPSDRTRKNVVDAKPLAKKQSIAEVRTPLEERRASERPRSNSCRQSSVKPAVPDPKNKVSHMHRRSASGAVAAWSRESKMSLHESKLSAPPPAPAKGKGTGEQSEGPPPVARKRSTTPPFSPVASKRRTSEEPPLEKSNTRKEKKKKKRQKKKKRRHSFSMRSKPTSAEANVPLAVMLETAQAAWGVAIGDDTRAAVLKTVLRTPMEGKQQEEKADICLPVPRSEKSKQRQWSLKTAAPKIAVRKRPKRPTVPISRISVGTRPQLMSGSLFGAGTGRSHSQNAMYVSPSRMSASGGVMPSTVVPVKDSHGMRQFLSSPTAIRQPSTVILRARHPLRVKALLPSPARACVW